MIIFYLSLRVTHFRYALRQANKFRAFDPRLDQLYYILYYCLVESTIQLSFYSRIY